jgi:glycosyltransferase involved in cell wall biosynthesis
MRSIVYRRSLSFTSGAGQLMAMQVRAMRAAGIDTQLACQRGALRFWMRAGLRARRVPEANLRILAGSPDLLVIDHGMELPDAQFVFAHNLMAEARNYLSRPDIDAAAEREQAFFSNLNRNAVVVANSELVRDAITKHYDWPADQLRVCYPGFRTDAFASDRRAQLRAQARRELGLDEATPLVGFVTSGDLHKRGLGVFIDTAVEMLAERPDLRFLITGSKTLPDWMRQHTLLTRGQLLHRPRSRVPERWMSALDVFLYPARFEEFGMVVMEACALGVPLITSRRVGASECLPDEFAPWLCATPEPRALAHLGLRLLGDRQARAALSQAGSATARAFSGASYGERSVSIIAPRSEAAA